MVFFIVVVVVVILLLFEKNQTIATLVVVVVLLLLLLLVGREVQNSSRLQKRPTNTLITFVNLTILLCHLKTLEDELKGTMSKALGNQGEKVLALLQRLHQERSRYEEILSSALVGSGGAGVGHPQMSLVLEGQEGTNTNSLKTMNINLIT
jgi:hypothetical protein